jgi:AmiR/NasT family two-component response regulator
MSDEPSSDHGEHVMQAADMVRAQADCTTEEAFVLMHERATMSRTSMEQVIAAVVDGSIHFDD